MARPRRCTPQQRRLSLTTINLTTPTVATARTRTRPRLLFARSFLANPRGTGSLIPSSRRLINRLLGGIDWSKVHTVVEYGPGTGVVTRALLARLGPDAKLIAMEINPDFVSFLKRDIPDTRLTIVAASAESVAAALAGNGRSQCDVAVSSLPFSIMPDDVCQAILVATAAAMAPDAVFVGYQYSTRWLGALRQVFGQVSVRFELRNWPPAFVFNARVGSQ